MLSGRGRGGKGDAVTHEFGGDWTEQKLRILDGYLAAWAKILDGRGFDRHYLDLFAGTGTRDEVSGLVTLPGMDPGSPSRRYDGSARLALQVQPRFDQYVFGEADRDKARELEALKADYPDHNIMVLPMDANEAIRYVHEYWNPGRMRGVMFLDPYGMELDWSSMELVGKMTGLDVWLLVGIDMGMNRMLADGHVDAAHEKKLTRFLGTESWREAFYKKTGQTTLFGLLDSEQVRRVPVEVVQDFYLDRLRSIFVEVAPKPRVLCNSKGRPLFMLCFAMTNPSERARKPALRIARHLLE